MPSVKIVTDTTASLPPGFAATHGVAVVSQVVRFGNQAYLEEVELTFAEFIRRLKASPQLPGTSAPPPGQFIQAYARQTAGAATVLSLHPSSDVSGTLRSAQAAKDEAFPKADIRILDTRTVAGNLGTLVQLAVGRAEAGQSADEIMRGLTDLIPRGRTYFLVPTLEYLQRGGRIGGAAALLGGVLQVKPLLELRDGRVEALEKVRTYQRALARLEELARANCPRSPDAHLCVMHAGELSGMHEGVPEEAQRLADSLSTALGLPTVSIVNVGAAITTHAGPGTLGVGFFGEAS